MHRKKSKIGPLRSKKVFAFVATATTALSMVALGASSASAQTDQGTTMLRSWPVGLCLDSNANGHVYALGCYPNNSNFYQQWQKLTVDTRFRDCDDEGNFCSDAKVYQLKDKATGRCLDSNYDGIVYTSPCQDPNPYQSWYDKVDDKHKPNAHKYVNFETGRTLEIRGDESVVTNNDANRPAGTFDIKRGF